LGNKFQQTNFGEDTNIHMQNNKQSQQKGLWLLKYEIFKNKYSKERIEKS
jgi:hypothetical protein